MYAIVYTSHMGVERVIGPFDTHKEALTFVKEAGFKNVSTDWRKDMWRTKESGVYIYAHIERLYGKDD